MCQRCNDVEEGGIQIGEVAQGRVIVHQCKMKQKRTQVDKLHIIHSGLVYGEGFIKKVFVEGYAQIRLVLAG